MIIPFKNRIINNTQKVEVYRNLHNSMFSIRQSGLVVAHGNNLILKNVQTKISEKGRQRVNKEKRKNVHAMLVGESVFSGIVDIKNLDELYYNPYINNTFINKKTKEKINKCRELYLADGKVYIIKQ